MRFPDQAASGNVPFEARPPFEPAGDACAPRPDAAALPFQILRPTATKRAWVRPRVWEGGDAGYPTDHRYVRRFWTAAIGPGAVADLIRLAVAAQRDRSLPLPGSLPQLVAEGLCALGDDAIYVRVSIPPLPAHLRSRLSPRLRREHLRLDTTAEPVQQGAA